MTPNRIHRRSTTGTYVIVAIIAVGLLIVFNWIVQRQASETARQTANRVAVAAHRADVKLHAAQLAACERGNVIRRAIRTNTKNLAQFEEAVAAVRGGQAKVEMTEEARKHDLEGAARYRKLIAGLTYVPEVACATFVPEP